MSDWLKLMLASARNRAGTLLLCWVALCLASTLLIAVERLRHEARDSYARTAAGIDLIVGARGSALELLMAGVFHHGNVRQEVGRAGIDAVRTHPAVAWVVPVTLGDSHRGHAVVGTTSDYLEYLRGGDGSKITFAAGQATRERFDAVLGADTARDLGYKIGDTLTLAHGESLDNEAKHDHDHKHAHGAGGDSHDHNHGPGEAAHAHNDFRFTVSGILAPSGTPADRVILVGQEALEALHLTWSGGMPLPGVQISPEQLRHFDLQARHVGVLLVGLKERGSVFTVQQALQSFRGEALQAVIPAQALDQLWQFLDGGERLLGLISKLMLALALMGLVATLLASLQLRRRELSILRVLGMRPWQLMLLPLIEGVALAGSAALVGLGLSLAGLHLLTPWLQHEFALTPLHLLPQIDDFIVLSCIVGAAAIASLLPGVLATRRALANGLNPKY